MKNIKISLIFLLSSIFSLNLSAVPEGAFTTLMVQAKDIDKYVDFLKESVDFDNFGSEQAGYCKTEQERVIRDKCSSTMLLRVLKKL